MTSITQGHELAARAAIAQRTEAIFRASGALRNGHFRLKSGRHSDAYLEKFAVLSDPAATSELCGFWAARHGSGGAVTGASGRLTVDLVAGPTTGGVILAFETGRQLGTRAIFAEEVGSANGASRREFRRGFAIAPGERVLLVDDILTTGGSLLAMIPAVEAAGGEIVECDVLVDRSGGLQTLTSPATGRVYPLRALWSLELPTYEPGPAGCPRCAADEPIHIPGSSGATPPS
jgi:orotate phosphoribosyltransferase